MNQQNTASRPNAHTDAEKTVWETLDTCEAILKAAIGADQGVCPPEFMPTKADVERETSPPWVLCVDDDPDYSLALRQRLEAHGVAVVRAFDGIDGYHTASTRPADAIVLDYEMPNGRGDDVLVRLKDNPQTREIPVVVVTGRKDRALRRKMLTLGASAYLTKPLIFSELLEQLGQHINVLPTPSLPCR